MHSLYTVAEIRAAEQAGAAALPPGTLMARAGLAGADLARDLIAGHEGPVLVLAGPGNNGGDALEVAANLAAADIEVALIHLASGAAVSDETARACARAAAARLRRLDTLPPGEQWALVIDGLYGIGLARPLEGAARALALALRAVTCPVLALDIPSGLDADTGAVAGPEALAVRATHTLTFIGDKPGLHTNAGRDHAGRVRVADLGIDPALLPAATAQLNDVSLFAARLQARRHASHKGSFGDVAIVGGAPGMLGAALLAARGALFGGAGRVYVAAIERALAVDPQHPEIMFREAAAFNQAGATLVMGPGMGDSALAMRLLAKAIDADAALVVDADALNLVAASPDLQARLAARDAPAVLTPHPLEAARLLGVTAAVIQADRLAAAREMASRLQAVVVLKGSGTVIADTSGSVVINGTGNPGLATGGTGDVLAGLSGALLAQGWSARQAALGAVWLHGAAADRLGAQGIGPIGLTAGELPAAVRALLNQLSD